MELSIGISEGKDLGMPVSSCSGGPERDGVKG